MFDRFLRERRGSVLPTFAIAALPLLAATGAVVDYTNAFKERSVVQYALDSAVLAAGKKIGLLTTAELKTEANNFYLTNIGGKIVNPPTLSTSIVASTITGTAELHVPTYFLGIIGLNEIVFNLKASATVAMGTIEVVLALDNSGSMDGSKISTLRTAAVSLVARLFTLGNTSTKPDPVKIGIVPFAAAVNVGPAYANDPSATWLDKTAVATTHGESFEPPETAVNVFDLFNAMKNQSWGGCVEERPMPYDATDEAASTANKATMFVPMFAPDEPDNWTCTTSTCSYTGSWYSRSYSGAPSGSKSYNNYLKDNGGSCQGSNTAYTGSSNEQAAFARVCKYQNNAQPVSIKVGGIPGGPNFMCTTSPLMPLTTTQSSITAAAQAMQAEGATNILSGLMWGWRLLSPTPPFTEGRLYTENDNQKILILMTDGENTYYPNGTFLKSWYGAWGYVKDKHLGTDSTSTGVLVDKMNERTALACANAKAAGIKIYTIAFEVSDPETLAMLATCATEPSMAYQSKDTGALLAAFTAIGEEITLLRVVE